MYEYECRVLRVVDGDTVEIDLDLGLRIHKRETVRLFGINAPEITGPTAAKGQQAATALWTMVIDRTLRIRTHMDKDDKYGRLLGVFWDGDRSINQAMIEQGHAVPYMTK